LIAKVAAILILAAALEVGGDALVRIGLEGAKFWMVAGAVTLFAYGVVVNTSGLDFNRLMGIYIAVFFLVSQIISWVAFRQIPDDRILIGGGMIVAGGLVIMLMA
jgi:small multidrug resistance family-3 protein